MAKNPKHVDLNIQTCRYIDLSTKHGIKHKKDGDLCQKHKESKKHARESNKSCYSSKNSKIKARKRFRRLGVWMIARKATSKPLNPKTKVYNQGKEDWV